jgi:hypothetical protein
MKKYSFPILLVFFLLTLSPIRSFAWYDKTHIAIVKVTGYPKWFNACGADMIKVKAPEIETGNHYVNNPPGTVVTPKMVLDQASRYDHPDENGHLYGAIIASLRNYIEAKKEGKYGEYHLAFCSHYVGDLSMPLHNTLFDSFNRAHHAQIDGIINDEVLDNLVKIKIYPITINSEEDLAKETARIANLSIELGYRLERENRLLTKEEAYEQISQSASLFKGILGYVGRVIGKDEKGGSLRLTSF